LFFDPPVFGGSGFYHPQGIPEKYDQQSHVHYPTLVKVGFIFEESTGFSDCIKVIITGPARDNVKSRDVSRNCSLQVHAVFYTTGIQKWHRFEMSCSGWTGSKEYL
jgi:hypothetical protein